MHFLNDELNERIEIFATDRYRKILSNAPVIHNLDELKKELFTTLSRFNTVVKGITYECAFSPSSQNELYVFLSGAAPRQGGRANFDRISWHQYFNGCCINIEDPTYKIRNVNSCWGGYFGDEKNCYIDGVEIILRKIQEIYESSAPWVDEQMTV